MKLGSRSASPFYTLRNKLLIHESNKNVEYKEIVSEILKSINLAVSSEINDTRKSEFVLNVQEVNWLRRFPEEKWAEYLIYRYIFRIYPQKQKHTNFPPDVLIEPTSICNLRCIMCFQVDKTFTNKNFMGRMPWNLFTKIVDEVAKNKYEKIRVKGKFEKVLKNIILFNEIRNKEFKNSRSVTRISGVKVNNDQDIDQMTMFWKQHVDEVSIKPATPRWDSYFNEVNTIKEPCNQLWERIYIWYDGKINPCDFDYKSHLSIGNINEISIKEAWNSKSYNLLRSNHLMKKRSSCYPCDRCPL